MVGWALGELMAGQERFTRMGIASGYQTSMTAMPVRAASAAARSGLTPAPPSVPEPSNGAGSDAFTSSLLRGLTATRNFPDRLVVKTGGRVLLIRVEEIDWIDASGNYVTLHVAGESHRMRETMAGIESRLDPSRFLRVHRCTIVNIERVRELQPQAGNAFRGEYALVLRDGTKLSLSRSHRDQLHRILGDSV